MSLALGTLETAASASRAGSRESSIAGGLSVECMRSGHGGGGSSLKSSWCDTVDLVCLQATEGP